MQFVSLLGNIWYIIKFENRSNKHVLEADLLNYLRTGYDIYLFKSYGPKTKFELAAAAILNLLPVAIFNKLPTFHC